MNKNDLRWAGISALAGAIIGCVAFLSGIMVHFYQFFMPELVYLACDGQIGHPGSLTGPLLDFLSNKTSNFDCADLPLAVSSGELGIFPKTHLYLFYVVAALWRIFSPSNTALLPFICLLYGTYVVGCFALLRQFFPRKSAVIGTALLALSSGALMNLLSVRDFAKAPFIIWGLVLLITSMRANNGRQQLLLAGLAGAATGIGFGFRTDVAILTPIALVLLSFGAVDRTFVQRALANTVFLSFFVVCAWPMLAVGKGGTLGAMVLEGASDPFNTFLGLGKAPYSWGARYSDELTLSAIAADLRTKDPDWDANEGIPVHGLSQAMTGSSSYLMNRMDLLVGDMATRSVKAGLLVLAYPSLLTPQHAALDPSGPSASGNLLARQLRAVYRIVGTIWTIPVALLGFLAFLLRESANRPRQTIALTIGFGILLCYTSLQFSVRHFFYLEFFWILAALGLFHTLVEWRALASAIPRFLIWSAVGLAGLSGVYIGLVTYQDRSVRSALDALLSGPIKQMNKSLVQNGDKAVLPIPVPDARLSLIRSAPDSMVGDGLPISPQWDIRAGADRLLFSLGGDDCPTGTITLELNYDKTDAWQALDQVITVHRRGNETTNILLPAIYRPTQHLKSVSLAADQSACLLNAGRLTASTRLPALFTAVLPDRWRERPLHLQLFARSK